MVRPDKAAAVAELTEAFRDSSAAVLTEYRGLTVAELKELRRSLAGNATYAVVKNTLTKIAARDAGIESFESLLEGPSAIAFVSGDPVEVAKGLRSFGREHPRLIVKGGILDGKPLTADEIRRLADLESREVLLAKFAGGMLAPAQQLVTVLAAPAAAMARALGALEAKLAADPDAVKAAADAAPEAAADTAPDADSAPEAAAGDGSAADSTETDSTETDSTEAAVPPVASEVEDLAESIADEVAPAEAAAPPAADVAAAEPAEATEPEAAADSAPAEAAAPTDATGDASETAPPAEAGTDVPDAPTENTEPTTTDGNAAASSDS
jgi:large subunit ribosomal protein L10